ncbi:MAG TPA: nicotinate phosphoribosyltransferase [Desulfomonilaceae bacterium]|nr:nicotinate phosphoribosyltransferase [Desulfomonilaceae bacterium]
MKPILRDPSTGRVLDCVEIIDSESQTRLGTADASGVMEGLRAYNYTLDTDLYELTMVAGYRVLNKSRQNACFDLYYRQNPDDGAFCVCAGLESVIQYVNKLSMYPDDLDYLESLGLFSAEALKQLASGVCFTGDIWAVPEGTVVFPNEPLIRVTGPIDQAQILETTLLALVGHQTLIATKAARMCIAAKGSPVIDFGTRRAHGVRAALYGARSSYIGGCAGTSNVKAGKLFGVPVRGTHAHSWVESFDNERNAFEAFADIFPDNCVLLVDTYDTIEGVRQAVGVAERMRSSGKNLLGIRIDSGDLAYYSKAARYILDEAGFSEVKILASSDLDEWLIESLRDQGARIDVWCVGTRLMTSYQTPALGIVYKLMAADRGDGTLEPKIKISSNPQKITNPGVKKIVRFFNGNNRMIGDLLTQEEEALPKGEPVRAHHPMYDYMKKMYMPPYTAEELLVPVFINGKQVYESPGLDKIRQHALQGIESLEPEYKRFRNPHIYKVSLSDKAYHTKKNLLNFYQERPHTAKK